MNKPTAQRNFAGAVLRDQGEEIQVFEAAYNNCIPVLLKGPTGCGKTRFMEHMAWRLKRPLVTVSAMMIKPASDLVGRYLIVGGETRWIDGPLTHAVRTGRCVTLTRSLKPERIRPWSSIPGRCPGEYCQLKNR
ncbi:MAG: hypothetical protein Ct9H300mP14_09100 [Gammaproteobacteria bacterium]|nr:MAG: hypothetical protein Ct9H300mP14_09100 [Gammaproteobacteria bacterium]